MAAAAAPRSAGTSATPAPRRTHLQQVAQELAAGVVEYGDAATDGSVDCDCAQGCEGAQRLRAPRRRC